MSCKAQATCDNAKMMTFKRFEAVESALHCVRQRASGCKVASEGAKVKISLLCWAQAQLVKQGWAWVRERLFFPLPDLRHKSSIVRLLASSLRLFNAVYDVKIF
jgi:hypothetical protein